MRTDPAILLILRGIVRQFYQCGILKRRNVSLSHIMTLEPAREPSILNFDLEARAETLGPSLFRGQFSVI